VSIGGSLSMSAIAYYNRSNDGYYHDGRYAEENGYCERFYTLFVIPESINNTSEKVLVKFAC
jgi:hypothetical protein